MRISAPSPAAVVAVLALCLATGGVGYAAGSLPKNSVTSAAIRNGAVKGVDVKNDSLTGTDVKESTLVMPTKARVMTLSAYDFRPFLSQTEFTTDGQGNLRTQNPTVGDDYLAVVHLPEGAVVTGIKVFVEDGHPAAEIGARSLRIVPSVKGYTASATVLSVGSSTDVQTLVLPVQQPGAGGMVGISLSLPEVSSLKLWGAEVDYRS